MRRRIVLAVIAGFALALAASLGYAAAAKSYQYSGSVTEVTATTISVDKGGEIWQFGLGGVKPTGIAKGDKVTVYYRMTATKIDKK